MYKKAMLAVTAAILLSAMRDYAQDPSDADRIPFKTTKWGPLVWRALHTMALNLPRDFGSSHRAFERYLKELVHVLPCRTCRREFKLMLNAIHPRPFLRKGRSGAVGLMFVYHTLVTEAVGKSSESQPFLKEEAMLLSEYSASTVNGPAILDELKKDIDVRGVSAMMASSISQFRVSSAKRAREVALND